MDYNRSGVALIEIVTEPVLIHPEQAKIFMQRVKQIVNFINISNAEMEKGKLRCDANISLSKKGSGKFGVKTEIKNINSFRNVQKAIESEIIRQNNLLNNGNKGEQATLTRNNDKNTAEIITADLIQKYNSTPQQKSRNRRVEITFLTPNQL